MAMLKKDINASDLVCKEDNLGSDLRNETKAEQPNQYKLSKTEYEEIQNPNLLSCDN